MTVLGPESQRPLVEEVGATLIAGAEFDPGESDIAVHIDALTSHLTSTDRAREALAAIEIADPEVALVDCMHLAALAAVEKAALRSAVFVHMRFGFFTEEARSEIDSWLRAPLAATRADLGLGALNDNESVARQLWDRCDTALSMLVPALETPIERQSRNLVHVGPIFEEAVTASHGEREPLIAVSFSTTQMGQGAVIQNVLDAVEGMDAKVVCSTSGVSVGDLRVPSNVDVAPWVDHAALLARASLIVTHAGMGTELAALAHGVPIVAIPMGRDQDGNAAQVAEIGAGVRLATTASPSEIRSSLETVLAEASYGVAARRVARDIGQFENGVLARSSLDWL